MRRLILAFFLLTCTAAAAQTQNAQSLYAERRALLEADSACRLFTAPVRGALQAGAWQARGALLRSGWTSAGLAELESAAINAARARRCGDARTEAAAERVRASFGGWSRLASMRFPGGERAWTATRFAGAEGWLIAQEIASPRRAVFGLYQRGNESVVALIAPLRAGEQAPATAEIALRDPLRARTSLFDVPGRNAHGLAAGVPSAQSAQRIMARNRRVETPASGVRQVIFVYPSDLLTRMAALDPREAASVQFGRERILIEIGDIAAARAFLAAQAGS
ncbi:MAG: hypothetical protein AB7L65_04550 [Hyphomonadaceae bacterium]